MSDLHKPFFTTHANTSGETLRYLPHHPAIPISVTPDNPLIALICRLEAATSRLEDIASSTSSTSVDRNFEHPNGVSATQGDTALQHGSKSEPELPGLASRESTSTVIPAKKEDLPPSVEAMDELISEHVTAFVAASQGLDALVKEQTQSVAQAFADQRRFLLVSTKAKKPDPQSKAFMDLLTDLQHHIGSIGDIRDSNRGSPMKEHLAMVGEGTQALQWLIMDGKPADFVGEVVGGAQMYGNRVLKTYKEGDQAHVKYVRSYYALLEALKSYIKKHYPSGVTWNNNGEADAVTVYQQAGSGPTPSAKTNGASSSTAGAGAGPPPPPPPPPLPNFDNVPSSSASSAKGVSSSGGGGGGDMSSVFEQLNKGESVTSGLKKVDKSQMTHKNPSLRAGGTVPDTAAAAAAASATDIARSRSPGPEVKPKPPSMRQNSTSSKSPSQQSPQKKDPRTELDGNKWLLSNHDSPSAPLTLDVSLTQSLLITKCSNTTIILRGKANAISIDNCTKTQILVENLVSSIDVIKCNSFAVQVTGALPTILLDQVDGASIYLGKASLGTEVFTSKSSGVNVVLPPPTDGDEEGDSVECPLPEQIRTVIREGKVVSEIVEHAG